MKPSLPLSLQLLSRKTLPLLCFALSTAAAPGEIAGDFEGHRLGVGDDRAAPNAFLGKGGKGWVRNWIIQKQGDGIKATGIVMNQDSLTPDEEKYVQVITTSEGEKGGATLYRNYEAYEGVDPAGMRTVKFLFRLDSDIKEFTSGYSINFSEDRLAREIGGSWWISAPGGEYSGAPIKGRKQEILVWNFYHGSAGADFHHDGFISSQMPLEKEVTYRFEITEDPATRRWKATISNGKQTVTTANPDDASDPWLNYRYQSPKTVAINPAGHILFHVAVEAGGSVTYSMAGLRIGSTETE